GAQHRALRSRNGRAQHSGRSHRRFCLLPVPQTHLHRRRTASNGRPHGRASCRRPRCLRLLQARRDTRGRAVCSGCAASSRPEIVGGVTGVLARHAVKPAISSPASCSLLLGYCPTSHTDSMASDANTQTLRSFLDYLRVERGSAKLTIAAYESDLAQFAEFLEKWKQNLTGARREDVRAYIQELFSNQLDGRSVGRKLSAIRHLYRQLLLDGKIDKDPTLNIDLPKQWKVLPKALSRDEVGAMLAETPPRNDMVRGRALTLRDHAMLELLYAGGVRVSEVADARLEDLKLEMGYILVRGKGDKERMVPLGVPAQQALQGYLKNGREVLARKRSSPLL